MKSFAHLNKKDDLTNNKQKKSSNKIKHEIYNGNSDKVALYQYISNIWSNTPYLAKTYTRSKMKTENKKNEFTSDKVIKYKII